ncbi:MAG: cell division protein FtsZ, partial [Treponema sp.]|nr:cell division protein FtsZ [Treponema sp.]
ADEILRQGIQGISDSILETGRINIDFADVMTVMKDQGDARMGIGYGEGENRVEEAVSGILDNPLLEDVSIKGAKRALVYVAGSEDLPIIEFKDVLERITADMDKNAIVIPGMYLDRSLGEKIRVTVIATGFDSEKDSREPEAAPVLKTDVISTREYNTIIGHGLFSDSLPRRSDKRDDFRYESEDLDVPTVIRDRRFFSGMTETMAKAPWN